MIRTPLRLVIFDCDGVLVDSEGPAARVTAHEISLLGWPMTADQAMVRFMGLGNSFEGQVLYALDGRDDS